LDACKAGQFDKCGQGFGEAEAATALFLLPGAEFAAAPEIAVDAVRTTEIAVANGMRAETEATALARTAAADADAAAVTNASRLPLRVEVGLEEQFAGCAGGSCSLAEYADLQAARANLEQIPGALADAPNAEMLSRIEAAISDGTDLTVGQRNFLDHEILEGQLIADGVPQEIAHVIVQDVLPPGSNYDLDVLRTHSDQFNSSQFRYWGANHPRNMP
jgi:hypothetical protein